MRWESQKVQDGESAALIPLKGMIRSVRTPEFDGVTFHEVAAKSALNRVPGQSSMPFEWTINPTRGCLHQCVYCLDPETLILMADGRQKPLRDVQVGERIVGTESRSGRRRYVETEVQAAWRTKKPAYRVTLRDGTELTASGDHRFLTQRGWKHVAPAGPGEGRRPHLTTSSRLMGFGSGGSSESGAPSEDRDDCRRGRLTGMMRGDRASTDRTYTRRSAGRPDRVTTFRLPLVDAEALSRSQEFSASAGVATSRRFSRQDGENRRRMDGLFSATRRHDRGIAALMAWPEAPSAGWRQGYLAGFVDAEISSSRGALRPSDGDERMHSQGEGAVTTLHVPHPGGPGDASRLPVMRVTGGRAVRRRSFHLVSPSITGKLTIVGDAVRTSADLTVESVEPLAEAQSLIDITTGTGDFIANGVISHNCFARKTHEYLDLDAGRDFDSQIIVKTNIAEVLRAELARPSWMREHVALGTNSDPYMRAEGRYRLMPGVIRALAESGTPFSILTKGPLLKRDLPLLQEAARLVPVSVAVSLAMVDPQLQQRIEPGTSDPRARLNLIRSITEAGLECSVLAMPILPWLSDDPEQLDALHAGLADAGASEVTAGALHLRPGAREWFLQWLAREHPELVGRYRRLYRGGSYAAAGYRSWLARQAAAARRRHGFDRPERPRGDDVWRDRRDPSGGPGSAMTEIAASPAQPSLF